MMSQSSKDAQKMLGLVRDAMPAIEQILRSGYSTAVLRTSDIYHDIYQNKTIASKPNTASLVRHFSIQFPAAQL